MHKSCREEKNEAEKENDHAELVYKQCLYISEALAGCKYFLLQDSFIPLLVPPAPAAENNREAQKAMFYETAEHCKEQMREEVWIRLQSWIEDGKAAGGLTVCVCVSVLTCEDGGWFDLMASTRS